MQEFSVTIKEAIEILTEEVVARKTSPNSCSEEVTQAIETLLSVITQKA
jgi:hypothetical protein